jgi:hypothetical protein
VAVRILETFRNILPVFRLIGLGHTLLFGLYPEGDPVVRDIRNRALLFGDQLRERLSGVLVVMRNFIPQIFLYRPEHP